MKQEDKHKEMESKVETVDLVAAAPAMYHTLERLEESAEYWGEYDVPLGIVDDIKDALSIARGLKQ